VPIVVILAPVMLVFLIPPLLGGLGLIK
jgi:hypothetical protein